MEKGWDYPKKGFVKVNVHAVYLNNRFPNGNRSGVGIVLRDDTGSILMMVSGSITGISQRANELWAFLAGLRCAYSEDKNNVQLETDNSDALKEWEEWRWWLDPNHARVIQQLEQRKKDPNVTLEMNSVTESENRLARYLAVDGAENRTRLVVYRRFFGRVRELWRLDMGLGPVEDRFMNVDEEDYENRAMQVLDDEVEGPDANSVMADMDMVAMGREA